MSSCGCSSRMNQTPKSPTRRVSRVTRGPSQTDGQPKNTPSWMKAPVQDESWMKTTSAPLSKSPPSLRLFNQEVKSSANPLDNLFTPYKSNVKPLESAYPVYSLQSWS